MSTNSQDPSQHLYTDEVMVVEPHGIEHIGDNERHGKPYLQGTIWFAAQINFVTVLIGSLAVVFGLGFWVAVITCVTANIVGALMNSAAVAMGPKLGMPQMPMSRAAFGYVGNYLPAFLASTLFVGYFATTNIVGAETVQQIWSGVPYTPVAIILGIVAIGLTIYGYNLVHSIERYMSMALGAVFVILTITAFVHGVGPSHTTTVHGTAFWESVALEFMIIFSFTASWAPYASDFSRYLPASTPSRKPFGWSFLGMLLGTSWMNIVGIYLGTLADKGGILPSIRTISHGFADVAYVGIIVGGLMVCAINAYSGALSGITWNIPLKRVPAVILIGSVSIVLSVAFGGPKFQASLEDFLYLVAYFVTPWLAVVIIDFWVLNSGGRGYPDLAEFYKRTGAFGSVRWAGFLSFVIGIAVSVPFMATVLYTGPIGKAMGGADVSYGVSALVAGVLYYVWGRRQARARGTATVRSAVTGSVTQ
ncbi:MAG TPA: cytosine permease [Streptosporangiaceae bacterium]|nr:cytosine permease [Streptosporangiaceae bacterium]